MNTYSVLDRGASGIPIKMWDHGVPMEAAVLTQAQNLANVPGVTRVAIMPDAHVGNGACVGSAILTEDIVIPAAVGVDIGCVDAETEFLSPHGWKHITDWDGDYVMQFNPETGAGEFTVPEAYIVKEYSELLHFKTKYGIDQVVSPDHRVVCWRITGRDRRRVAAVVSAQDLADEHERLRLGAKVEIETAFTLAVETQMALSDIDIRVQTMTNADAYMDGHVAQLALKKPRKIARAKSLLQEAGRSFAERELASGVTHIRYIPPLPAKGFSSFWGASYAQLLVITEECLHWDGNLKDRVFFSRIKESADFIQYAFSATGQRAVLRTDVAEEGTDYRVFAYETSRVGLAGVPKSEVRRVRPADGMAYCFTVPTGAWVMRRNGNVAMTGNCGMVAARTPLHRSDLDDLPALRARIEARVPVGRTNDGQEGDRGSWGTPPPDVLEVWATLAEDYAVVKGLHQGAGHPRTTNHLGTLGTGNHFIEVCVEVDESDDPPIWVMLHSGSRGVGNRIGMYFTKQAKAEMKRWHVSLPDPELAFLAEGTALFNAYIFAAGWAQGYAWKSRELMLRRTLDALGLAGVEMLETVHCHHNYVTREQHFGKVGLLTRKGAVNAARGVLGIIPGSMGSRSYITRGLGNPEALLTSSHGAGRVLSRTAARKTFTLEQHLEAVAGVECRLDADVIDETPGAYKSIDAVMQAQRDLTEPVHTLKQIVCVKG